MHLIDYPLLVFVLTFVVLWLATHLGAALPGRDRSVKTGARDDFNTILTSTLTLSGLIIGFTFSMAIGRYEQRKNYEEAEANAIGTEYERVGLLPGTGPIKVRSLLETYLHARIAFYNARGESELGDINVQTARLQSELWAAVQDAGAAQPTPMMALAVSGMNDVLNAQGYTQAAWWNRIPSSAWFLMLAIAIVGSLMMGYGAEPDRPAGALFMVLPCVLAISFLLIADIESPRGGLIHVGPRNLASLAESFQVPGSRAPEPSIQQ